MKIVSTHQVDAKEWDAAAAAAGGGYFHSHAETVYQASCEGALPLFMKATDAGGKVVGVATGVLAKSNHWPFSRYCNWAMLLALPAAGDGKPDSVAELVAKVEEHLRKTGAFSLRMYSYDSPGCDAVLSPLGYELSGRSEFFIDLTPPEETIWAGLSGDRRTSVRKAEKRGVATRLENTPEALAQVLSFYGQSMERHNLSPVQSSQDRSTKAEMERLQSGQVDVLLSCQNGTPVNGAVFALFGKKAYYLHSGSSPAGNKACGPSHAIWTAIRLYKERGAVSLNLGAALADQPGVVMFKQEFGATALPAPLARKRLSRLGSTLHGVRSFLGRAQK